MCCSRDTESRVCAFFLPLRLPQQHHQLFGTLVYHVVCVFCACVMRVKVSAHFGFKEECKMKYGLTVYYRFLLAFQVGRAWLDRP